MGTKTGIIRKLDNVFRIVIPMEFREQLEIKGDQYVVVSEEGKKIIIKKYNNGCVFCGKEKQLIEYKDNFICKKCLDEMKKKF